MLPTKQTKLAPPVLGRRVITFGQVAAIPTAAMPHLTIKRRSSSIQFVVVAKN